MVEKLEFSIGQIIKIPREEMCTNEKAKQTFLTTTGCTCTAGCKVIKSSHNPVFKCWKHMQISCKPVVQACNELEILMHTSKG